MSDAMRRLGEAAEVGALALNAFASAVFSGEADNSITFTTKMGNFIFDKNVCLSKAKMIRDSITGQFFNPKPNEIAIKTEDDAYKYAQSHLGRDLEAIPFSLSIGI